MATKKTTPAIEIDSTPDEAISAGADPEVVAAMMQAGAVADGAPMPKTINYTPAWYRENFPTRRMVRVSNPLQRAVSFELHAQDARFQGGFQERGPVRMRVVIAAQSSTLLPLEHLRGVKSISRDAHGGMVMAGLAPQLLIEGEGSVDLHPSIAGAR